MIQLLLEMFLALIAIVNVKAMANSEADIFARAESSFDDMGELGNFSAEYPFNYPRLERIYSHRPNKREKINTKFHFFGPSHKNIPQNIVHMIFNMRLFALNSEKHGSQNGLDTYIIIHDLKGEATDWQLKNINTCIPFEDGKHIYSRVLLHRGNLYNRHGMQCIKEAKNYNSVRLQNALLNKSDCLVIIVDSSDGYGELYEQSVANIRVVGAEVGLFMQRLVDILNLDPKFFHIIGHGLGAHAAGYAGKWFQERHKKLIGRITGLDPAGPYFNGVNKSVRLDKGDAAFVDVIHTNTEGKSIYGFGLKEPIGHVDFYPNGGETQPLCINATAEYKLDAMSYSNSVALFLNQTFGEQDSNPVEVNLGELNCSHYRACDYFIATLEEPDCKFESLSCYSWDSYFFGGCGTCENNACIRMGFYAYADARELQNERPLKLFVQTKVDPPYCYPELSSVLKKVFTAYKDHLLLAYRFKY